MRRSAKRVVVAAYLAFVFSSTEGHPASPNGYLDLADQTAFAGWAKDQDYGGPISVHFYVDGKFVGAVLANSYRADVGNHAFHWLHASFGPGTHQVAAYAIGVDSAGSPNGENPPLSSSPKYFTEAGPIDRHLPVGHLDLVNDTFFAGWARDDDYSGPILIRFYVDGKIVGSQVASLPRADVGNHAFHWKRPSFGPGLHRLVAYATGVDGEGKPTGNNRQIGNSPKYFQERRKHVLSSADGSIRVALDAKFGGAITEIYDYRFMGSVNLIDDEQAGAMFQTAFWLLPRHGQLPPQCSNTDDMWYDNPTQAGFVADGLAGNPIGIRGTHRLAFDPKEFIRYEGGGRTVHFRSRPIRYDYCLTGIGAPLDQRSLWDTSFHLEQWVFFHQVHTRTLVLRSKLSYFGSNPRPVTTRQLPILFAFHLPRLAYWKNGQKVFSYANSDQAHNPDQNWVALTAAAKEVGIGLVTSRWMRSQRPDRSRFAYGEIGTGQNGQRLSVLFPGALPDLRSMGLASAGVYPDPAHPTDAYIFQPGASFEWILYYPIGDLGMIKSVADDLLKSPSNFGQ